MVYSNIKGQSMGIAFAALVLLTLIISPISVHAAEILDYGYGDYYPTDMGYSDYGYGDYYASDYGYGDYYSDYSSYDSYGYQSYPSYSSPSYYTPSNSYYTPSNSYSSSAASAVSSVYAPTNTCTSPNSCNTSYDDHSVFNAPTVVTVTDYSNSDSNDDDHDYDRDNKKRKNYDRDYDYDHKVVYNYPRTPYVSLTQVPYTGLELGPVGTTLYWSFLVLWCLVMAYLIVVKRVQNTVLSKLNTFLFGDNTPAPVASHGTLSENDLRALAAMLRPRVAEKHRVATSPAPMPENAETDEFVLSQINRSRN